MFDEDHVPPEFGLKLVVVPMQMSVGPENPTIGLAKTVTSTDGSDVHPVLLLNVNVTIPGL